MKIEELMKLPLLCSAIVTTRGALTFSPIIFLFVREIISIFLRPNIWAQTFLFISNKLRNKEIFGVSEFKNLIIIIFSLF